MESTSDKSKNGRSRWQFRLPTLFALVTGLCIFFAFPRFVLICLALLAGVLVTLLIFILGFFYPIYWISKRLTSKLDGVDKKII